MGKLSIGGTDPFSGVGLITVAGQARTIRHHTAILLSSLPPRALGLGQPATPPVQSCNLLIPQNPLKRLDRG